MKPFVRGKEWLVPLAAAALFVAGLALAPRSPQAPAKVRAAAVQFVSRWASPAENRKALALLVREAARNGAKIVVLPEAAITGYMSHDLKRTWQVGDRKLSHGLQGDSPKEYAETVPGDSTREFGRLAQELGIYLTVPFVEFDPRQEKYFSTVVLVDPDGSIALHYRKLNPWLWAEGAWSSPGDRGLQFLDTPYGRLGLLISNDINFEMSQRKQRGVDHLLFSMAWVDGSSRSDWFTLSLPITASQMNFNLVGANWSIPRPADWSGYGHSLILNYDGQTAAAVKSDLGDDIIYADLEVPRRR
jgi:predicted amidohydrolase